VYITPTHSTDLIPPKTIGVEQTKFIGGKWTIYTPPATPATPSTPEIPPTYQEKRVSEYPPIGDQLDALYHAGVFPAAMTASIKAIKDKYPK
jgi:hypothetical protein